MTYVIAFAVGAVVGLAGAAILAAFGYRVVRHARRASTTPALDRRPS